MLSTALKARILDSFAKVNTDTAWGRGLHLFAINAHLKTDVELVQAIDDLQDQAKDNEQLMREQLGDQFEFLITLKLKN
jgi:hypothetical protein